ncbi:hypothetical protein Tco_1501228 [Tanacetum coccineum]
MCTYLKNMAGFTHSHLKNKSFDEVQKAFDKTIGWIDSFVSMDSKVAKGGKEKDEGSVTRAEESRSKRAGTKLEQERIKKQKIDDDQEEAEMKKHMEIVIDKEEIAVDAIPLATKPPVIVLSYDESKSRRVSERAFMTLFGQANDTFTSTMFLYVDQLKYQLDKDEFQEDKSMAAFWVLNNQFQKFIDWQYFLDYDSEMTEKLFAEYTGIQVKQFKETLLLHMGNVKKSVAKRTRHKRQYDRRMKERQMQSRESKDTSSSSGTYITHVVDADIRPVNDQVPSAKVHLTAQHNVLVNEQQYTNHSERSYNTYLLEKVDSNTTPDSKNMSHRG